MSIDYLEDMDAQISRGQDKYACPGPSSNEWILSDSLQDLRPRAQRSADSRRMQTHIFRLVNPADVTGGDSYLVIRKILEPGPRGEPHFLFALVDTRDAAEMLRDVSQGPSPFFGAIIQETFEPRKTEK